MDKKENTTCQNVWDAASESHAYKFLALFMLEKKKVSNNLTFQLKKLSTKQVEGRKSI